MKRRNYNFFVAALLLMLCTSYGYAQNVGVNTTTPKATLDIQPKAGLSPADAKGILIPRLSGNDIKAMRGMETSTMVYATSAATPPASGAPAEKDKNLTQEGYFYYDGSAWVKVSSGNDQEWAYLGPDTILLKRVRDSSTIDIKYLDNGFFSRLDTGYLPSLARDTSLVAGADWRNYIPNNNVFRASEMPVTHPVRYTKGFPYYTFNNYHSIIDDAHASDPTVPAKCYTGFNMRLHASQLTSKVRDYQSVSISAGSDTLSVTNAGTIQGARIGAYTHHKGAVYNTNALRLQTISNVVGHNSRIMGLDNYILFDSLVGNSDLAFGTHTYFKNRSKSNIWYKAGSRVVVDHIGSGRITSRFTGNDVAMYLKGDGSAQYARGGDHYIRVDSTYYAKYTQGLHTRVDVDDDSRVDRLWGQFIELRSLSSIPIPMAVGQEIYLTGVKDRTVDAYGLKIRDVAMGSGKNYAIYTAKGKNSLGDTLQLRNINAITSSNDADKIVVAGATDGVLKTKAVPAGALKANEFVYNGTDAVELKLRNTDANFKDSVLYTTAGYKVFDKTTTVLPVYSWSLNTNHNLTKDSINTYNYNRTRFADIVQTNPVNGWYTANYHELNATPGDTREAGYLIGGSYNTHVRSGNNANHFYANGMMISAFHNGGGEVNNVRGAYMHAEVGPNSKTPGTIKGSVSAAACYSSHDVSYIAGSESFATQRGGGTTNTMVGGRSNVLVGKINSNGYSSQVTDTVRVMTAVQGDATIQGDYAGVIGDLCLFNGVTRVAAGAKIANVYGIKLGNMPLSTGENYAMYTNRGKISFGDTVTIRNINGTVSSSPNDRLVVAGQFGQLKSRSIASLTPIAQAAAQSVEPWRIKNTNTGATTREDTIYTLGHVGIGESVTPRSALDVKGSISLNPDGSADRTSLVWSRSRGGNDYGNLTLRAGGQSNPNVGSEIRLGGYTKTNIILSTRAQDRMQINADGKVGIGTTDFKNELLTVGGNGVATIGQPYSIYNPDPTKGRIGTIASQSSTRNALSITADPENLQTESSIDFYIDGTGSTPTAHKMTIRDSGNVGIGTTAPAVKLDVGGAIKVGDYNQGGTAKAPQGTIRFNGTKFQGCVKVNGCAAGDWVDIQTTP